MDASHVGAPRSKVPHVLFDPGEDRVLVLGVFVRGNAEKSGRLVNDEEVLVLEEDRQGETRAWKRLPVRVPQESRAFPDGLACLPHRAPVDGDLSLLDHIPGLAPREVRMLLDQREVEAC
jgi:hypothetical protein